MTNGQSFTVLNTRFHCHIVDDGQRYEWRTADNMRAAGRNVGGPTCWARVQQRYVGRDHPSLKLAMIAAARTALRAAA
jgi:hypothetical protein